MTCTWSRDTIISSGVCTTTLKSRLGNVVGANILYNGCIISGYVEFQIIDDYIITGPCDQCVCGTQTYINPKNAVFSFYRWPDGTIAINPHTNGTLTVS
jgi:hypothetical protein